MAVINDLHETKNRFLFRNDNLNLTGKVIATMRLLLTYRLYNYDKRRRFLMDYV